MDTGYSKEESAILVKMYRTLLRKMRPSLKEGDAKQIRKAFNFAVEAHKNDRRKSGEPFIYHPISVAMICVEEMGLGATSVQAALLHDVVEDTEYSIKDIEDRFGSKVARIVDGLTKIKATMSKSPTMQAENFRKVLLTISEDARVVLIKIADRLHNMRTLDSMPKDKQLKIASETEYIYAPLAHRLGLYSIKSELEDLYLKYADPNAYAEVVSKLKNSEEARKRFIRMFSRPIEEAIAKQGFKFQIKSRTKSIRSIYTKMKKQGIPFEEVYDLFAIRIILDVPPDQEKLACWMVYSIVTDFYTPNTERTRDWVTIPKANGYESLHTTVMSKSGKWVEVQIRTVRMDEIAEKGYAAHWKYKEKGTTSAEQGIDLWLNHVREMMEKNDTSAMEFMDDFRSNLFQEEIFVFTPRGEMKMLPANASVLDFAFAVHTEIGNKCIGAKVNNKLVSLSYKLKGGDQIEILTSAKARPNEGWLRHVVTSKARSKIKDLLREDKKNIANYGKEIIARKLEQLKLPFGEKIIHQMMDYFNQKTELDLYYSIGSEMIPHTEIKAFHEATQKAEPSRITKRTDDVALIKKELKALTGQDELVIGDSTSIIDLEYSFASCCRPIPGDDIFGFTTSTNGIKIHRTNCPNATMLMANYGYRILKAKWATVKSNREFEAMLYIDGTDRLGLASDITRLISGRKVNIKLINMQVNEGIFSGTIGLSVHDRNELEELVRQLESVDGVVHIGREDELTAQIN